MLYFHSKLSVMYTCVIGNVLSDSTIYWLDFRTALTVWYFFYFPFYYWNTFAIQNPIYVSSYSFKRLFNCSTYRTLFVSLSFLLIYMYSVVTRSYYVLNTESILPNEFTSCFSGVRVTWSLVLCVCFVYRCLSFCPFSFGHCVICFSSIYVIGINVRGQCH